MVAHFKLSNLIAKGKKMKMPIPYYEHVLDFLTAYLNNNRYSSVCFELLTITISRLFRLGYICSYSETTNHWSVIYER